MRYYAEVLDANGAVLARIEADLERDLDVVHFVNKALAEYKGRHPDRGLLPNGHAEGYPSTVKWGPVNAKRT